MTYDSKKFLAGLLIISIISLMLPIHQAHAKSAKVEALITGAKTVVKAVPGFLLGAAKIGAGIIGTALLLKFLSGVIVELSGLIFNMSLGLALDNDNYSSKIDAIDAGWTFSRDVVNIFFIFILLFIAIATILGIESYGAKSLLARLIIIALLVNFSLLATRGIIYISNSLAVQIYNTQVNIKDGVGESGAITGILGLKFKKNLGAEVMNRFYLKELYEKAPAPDSASAIANDLFGFGTIELGAIVVALLASFLLFTASFLFITRMAVLWLLMILAPFGFVFLILPATRSYAQTWWKKLIDLAVFAPAFLFLFFIALKVLDKLGNFMGKANAIKSVNEFLALVLLQITIAFILLFASLMVAKQLGIYGSGGAMAMATKAGTSFRGYVGKGTKNTALRGGRYVGKAIENTVGRVPIIGTWARKPAAALIRGADKVKSEREEGWKKLTPDGAVSTYRATINPITQREMMKSFAEAGKIEKFSEKEMQSAYEQFKNNPADAKAYNNIVKTRPDLIEKDSSLSVVDKRAKMTDALSRMSEKDIEEKLDKGAFNAADPSQALTREMMVLTWGEREMNAAIRKHGNAAKDSVDRALADMGAPDVQFRNLYDNNKSLMRGLFRNPSLALQFKTLKGNMEREAARAYPTDWEHRLGIT